jgi:hypothetical protein
MTPDRDFPVRARALYAHQNGRALEWMLDRPRLRGAFLDTKLNSITLRDYGASDGLRGPDYLYGWIQGRGLEALATHAGFFEAHDPALARRLDAAGRELYGALASLQARDGHVYFCYDRSGVPIIAGAGELGSQDTPADIFTYSDAFAAKGLVAAAVRYAPDDLPKHLAYLADVIAAIETGRFQIDERTRLGETALAGQPGDFGPRMIVLGAAPMLVRIGRPDAAGFAHRFIAEVLAGHYHEESGLLANVSGEDACNVGHAIEFVGFALDFLTLGEAPQLVERLQSILLAAFEAGFAGPGIALSISIASGETLSPHQPWWSLPETIRAAACAHNHTASAQALAIWRRAHHAFFGNYWRETPPIAYQTLTGEGPVDFVPATPDLDPGYHTGLSLLSAIRATDAAGTPVLQTTSAR